MWESCVLLYKNSGQFSLMNILFQTEIIDYIVQLRNYQGYFNVSRCYFLKVGVLLDYLFLRSLKEINVQKQKYTLYTWTILTMYQGKTI